MEPLIEIDLTKIWRKIDRMARHVLKQYTLTSTALTNYDSDAALEVTELMKETNLNYDIILDDATFILAKRPLAKELRNVIGVLGISYDLRKMGNYSSQIVNFIVRHPERKITTELVDQILKSLTIFILNYKMMQKSISERFDRDNDFILQIVQRDKKLNEQIKETYNLVRASLVETAKKAKVIESHELFAEDLQALKIINYIGIASEHIKAICETLTYIESGDLRHFS